MLRAKDWLDDNVYDMDAQFSVEFGNILTEEKGVYIKKYDFDFFNRPINIRRSEASSLLRMLDRSMTRLYSVK